MNSHRLKLFGIILLWASFHPQNAQAQSTNTVLALTYDEALNMAFEQNTTIRNAQLNIEKSQGAVMTAKAIFDPTMTLSAGQNRRSTQQFFAGVGSFTSEVYGPTYSLKGSSYLPTGTTLSLDWTTSQSTSVFTSDEYSELEQKVNPIDTTLTLTLTQALLQGFKTQYNQKQLNIAKRSLTSAEWTAIESTQQTLSDTATAYWNTVYQAKMVALAEKAIQIAQEEERLIAAKLEQGNVAPMELDRVRAATLTSQVSLLDAQNAYDNAKESLLLLLALSPSTKIELKSPTPELNDLNILDVQKELDLVLQNNPNLQRLKVDIQGNEEALSNAKHAMLPELTGTARYAVTGWETDFSSALQEMTSGDLPTSYVGVNLALPIANWSDKGQLSQSKVALEQSNQTYETTERSLLQQAQNQIRLIQSTQSKIQLAKLNLEIAEQSLSSQRTLQEAGRNIEKDVLAAIQAVQDAEIQYEKAQADLLLALVTLKKLQGQVYLNQVSP